MYENMGSKIQSLGKVLGWLSAVSGVIVWFILIINEEDADNVWGWIALIGGVLNFFSSWLIIGFGELIDAVYIMNFRPAHKEEHDKQEEKERRDQKLLENGGWKCTCGRVNPEYISSCPCGNSKHNK